MSNIVDFKKAEKQPEPKPPREPFINLPPITKYLLILILAIHLVITFLISQEDLGWVIFNLGFTPAMWTGQSPYPFDIYAAVSPLTYIFLHGGWTHILMNCAMLMAFGAGIEQWMGARKFLIFFILCGILAIIAETIIHPFSINPVIGASGALSGLFAAVLILLQSQGKLPTGKYGIWPFAAFWVGISLLFGLIGGSLAGGQIAWAAHLGGFIAGFLLLRLRYFKTI
jgi:membrane associated rhomboid family serine protease